VSLWNKLYFGRDPTEDEENEEGGAGFGRRMKSDHEIRPWKMVFFHDPT
jgi:hypothetical protein